MFGPAEPDALSPESSRDVRLFGNVCIGSNLQHSERIGPFQNRREILILFRIFWIHSSLNDLDHFGIHHGNVSRIDLSGKPVQGEKISFRQNHGPKLHLAVRQNFYGITARNTDFSHLPGHDSRMRGHPALGRQKSFRCMHAMDIIRTRFMTDQNGPFPLGFHGHGLIRGESNAAGRSSRTRWKPFTD